MSDENAFSLHFTSAFIIKFNKQIGVLNSSPNRLLLSRKMRLVRDVTVKKKIVLLPKK